MQSKRLIGWLVLSALVVLALSGCAPRVGQGETAAQEGADVFAIDLPAIVIDVDADGNLSIGGVPLAALAGSFGASGLESLQLTPDQVTTLTGANIQHIQVNNLPSGLTLMVNGEEIPTLSWDADSLAALQTLAGQLDAGVPPILGQIIPVLGKVGIGVTVRLPLAQGAEMIPLEVTGEGSSATAAQTAQADFLASVGAPPRIVVPIQYAGDGSFTMGGMSEAEWIALTGQSALESLQLPADLIADLTTAGVSNIDLTTNADGVHISVNGQALPSLNWGEGRLSHALGLAASAGLLGEDTESLSSVIDALLPLITGSQIELRITLPG
jgi:sulfur carrier protein ThiS